MKIVDTNVLLYAVNSASAHHRTALRWSDESLSGAEVVGWRRPW
ncbi:MAG: type II toxin-antitoxin system VapC family toxin, partial [Actinomycetota bacterium]|nr:type II toxin-antitoxin system VapC family toxin [Actinomycetota bacterium]